MAARTWVKGAACVATLVALGACTKTDQKPADSGGAAVQQQAASSPAVASFTAKDFAFAGPDTLPAGETTIQLTNAGPSLHHLQLVRLDSGKTLADLQASMKKPGPLPAWAVMVGGPNAPDPGSQSNATVDLTPGSYIIACFVDQPGGIPHIMKGMVKPLTVVASTDKAAAPKADVSVTMQDYGYTFSTPLTAGQHTISVSNTGSQPHEFELAKLDSGKTVQDLLGWIAKPNGPPPGHALGGVDGLAPGQTPVSFAVNLTPGNYAAICFLPDAKDGKPHFAHGMIHTFSIN